MTQEGGSLLSHSFLFKKLLIKMQKKKKRERERHASVRAFGKNLWQLGEPSEAEFNVPLKRLKFLFM